MRKLYYLTILLFISFAFGSCTLVLEEIDDYVPEEMRGIDEPYTEIIPGVITTTYKYNDGVRPVTTKMRDYIASVEADTIVYFYDNIPSEMLPKIGEYLACGCHPQIPEGLNNKVLSVVRANGLYKVVTTRVEINEVYEMLVYDIDASVAPQYNQFYPSHNYRDSLESIGECETVDDWSLFEPNNPTPYMEYASTDTIVNSEKDSVSEYGFYFDSRLHMSGAAKTDFIATRMSAYVQKMVKYCKDKNIEFSPFVAIRMENKNSVRILSRLDTRTKYEYNATEEVNEQIFAIDAGLEVGFEPDTTIVNNDNMMKLVNSRRMKKLADAKFAKKLKTASAKLNGMASEAIEAVSQKIKIRLPGTVPISWQFELNVAFKVSVQGTVSACWTTTSKSITGYEVKDGVERPIHQKKDSNKNTDFTILLSGGFDIGLQTEARASVIFYESIGASIVGTLAAGGKAEAQLEFFENECGVKFDGEAKLYCDLTASLEVFFSPLGIDLWESGVELGTLSLMEKKFPMSPRLALASMPALKIDYPEYTKIIYEYSISDLGTAPANNKYRPLLAVYINEVKPENHFTDLYIDANEFAKTNVEYRFEQDILKDSIDVEYISIPLLYNEETDTRLLYIDYKHKYGAPKPYVEQADLYQTIGKEYVVNEFDFTEDELNAYISDGDSLETLYEYGFSSVVDLSYVSHMEGWGMHIVVKLNGMTYLCNKIIEINRYKAKRYTLNFRFASDINVDEGDVIEVTVCPFLKVTDSGSKWQPQLLYDEEKTIMLSLPPGKHKGNGNVGTSLDVNL